MAVNRGKKFEEVIKKSFLKVSDTTVTRLPDPTQGYLGIRNICDFIVYHYPTQYFIECKSVHGNTFPFSNITENQYLGLLEMSLNYGVVAGIIVWWVDRDVTQFIPIRTVKLLKDSGKKSIRFDYRDSSTIEIHGKKKRVFFDYEMQEFIERSKT